MLGPADTLDVHTRYRLFNILVADDLYHTVVHNKDIRTIGYSIDLQTSKVVRIIPYDNQEAKDLMTEYNGFQEWCTEPEEDEIFLFLCFDCPRGNKESSRLILGRKDLERDKLQLGEQLPTEPNEWFSKKIRTKFWKLLLESSNVKELLNTNKQEEKVIFIKCNSDLKVTNFTSYPKEVILAMLRNALLALDEYNAISAAMKSGDVLFVITNYFVFYPLLIRFDGDKNTIIAP